MLSSDDQEKLEPLLESSDENEDSDESSSDEEEEGFNVLSSLTSLTALAGVGFAIFSMVLSPLLPVLVMGGIACTLGPAVAVREQIIANAPDRRDFINQLRGETNRLQRNADMLTNNVNELKGEADRAKKVEEKLSAVASEQGKNVEALVSQVQEHKQLIADMTAILKKLLLQEMIRIFLASDIDRDFVIDLDEIEFLCLRLQLKFSTMDVKFNEDAFKKLVKRDNSTASVVNRIRDMLTGESKEKVQLFEFSDKSFFAAVQTS